MGKHPDPKILARDEEMLRLLGEGWTAQQLSERYQRSPTQIRDRVLKYMSAAEYREAWTLLRAAGLAKVRNSTPRPDADRDEAVRLYREGLNLRQIGERFGVTRERVRQWISERGESVRGLKAERPIKLDLLEQTATCVVCLGPVWSDRRARIKDVRNPTCSHECAELWSVARYYIDPTERQRQRVSKARAGLKRGDLTESRRRYYERIVNGAEIRTHFQYDEPKEGTRARRAFDQVMRKRARVLGLEKGE